MMKKIRGWWFGHVTIPKPEQSAYRTPGEVEKDPMNYKPGFWEATAKPLFKTVFFALSATAVVLVAGAAIAASCSYQSKTDAQADQVRSNTDKTKACKSTIVIGKDDSRISELKCDHPEQVLRTNWQGGVFTVHCLCPNTLEDEKTRPESGSNEIVEDKEEEKEIEKIQKKIEWYMDVGDEGIYL